ncbi:MAG TPA: flagellar biosynthetic protein FliR [Acidiphilium sp.]
MTGTSLAGMVFGGLLVFVRIGGAIMMLPGFTAASVPAMVRIGLTVALTAIIAPLVAGLLPALPATPILLAVLIAKEAAIGLTLGWLTRVIVIALPVAGQIISYQIGLASVLLPNAEIGAESTLIASALNIGIPAFMLGSGLFIVPLFGLLASFHWLPPGIPAGSVAGIDYGSIIHGIVAGVAAEFLLAIQLAAPFLIVGLVWQVGLGFMTKAAPQLQIFFTASPLQILGGLILLGVTVVPMIAVWNHAAARLLIHGFSP